MKRRMVGMIGGGGWYGGGWFFFVKQKTGYEFALCWGGWGMGKKRGSRGWETKGFKKGGGDKPRGLRTSRTQISQI